MNSLEVIWWAREHTNKTQRFPLVASVTLFSLLAKVPQQRTPFPPQTPACVPLLSPFLHPQVLPRHKWGWGITPRIPAGLAWCCSQGTLDGWRTLCRAEGMGTLDLPDSSASRSSTGHTLAPSTRRYGASPSCPTTSCWEVTSTAVPSLSKTSPSHRTSSPASSWLAPSCPSRIPGKNQFPSEDITRPVGPASFPCPFAYPSGALSDSGRQPRCLLCMRDTVRDALLGGLLLSPSHSCLSPQPSHSFLSSLPIISHVSFSLSFLLSQEAAVLTSKEKMTASLPLISFRVTEAYGKHPSEELWWREGIAWLCPKAASCPMDIKCTQCSALHGLSLQKVPELLRRVKALYWVEELSLLKKNLLSCFGAINIKKKDREKRCSH